MHEARSKGMKGLKDFAMNLQIAWMSMELWKWQYDLMMGNGNLRQDLWTVDGD